MMELINDHFQNYKRYQIPKAQLVIADIPYNVGDKAYGSIKRPEPKVLDADGVEIKVGDVVWMKGVPKGVPNEPLIVSGFKDDRVLMSFHNETSLGYLPDKLTHREPDSLKKAVDDLGELLNFPMCDDIKLDKVEEVYNRLTSLVERDA